MSFIRSCNKKTIIEEINLYIFTKKKTKKNLFYE